MGAPEKIRGTLPDSTWHSSTPQRARGHGGGFFLYICKELLIGLAAATESESDTEIKGKIRLAQVMTVISWCTYPVVYLFPMLGITAAQAVVGIQIGYCVSDIISKCGVGLVIYQITYAKSSKGALLG